MNENRFRILKSMNIFLKIENIYNKEKARDISFQYQLTKID